MIYEPVAFPIHGYSLLASGKVLLRKRTTRASGCYADFVELLMSLRLITLRTWHANCLIVGFFEVLSDLLFETTGTIWEVR
jgi:hypothetical protein